LLGYENGALVDMTMEEAVMPALVLPFHDPSGVLLAQLATITPTLRQRFSRAFLSVSPLTEQLYAAQLQHLHADPFFAINTNAPGTLPGDHYLAGYHNALAQSHPDQRLHLCDIDKLAAILQSHYRDQFLSDITAASSASVPTLFQRSPRAWATYSEPYRQIEHVAITLGQYLLHRYLDFAWSYLVIRAMDLQALVPQLQQRTFGLLAEMVLLQHPNLETQDVDWLFWEDPFIEARNPDSLRAEREASLQETQKRLKGHAPIIRLLLERIDQLA
jgi:hypothetical protein